MSRIITIEGIPCAGKSTLRENLQKNMINKEFTLFFSPTFAERKYFEEISPKNYPENFSEARNNEKWFLNYELNRLRSLKSKPDDTVVILERDFLSTLAFSYAYSKFKNIPSFYSNMNEFKDISIKDDFIFPDVRLVLDISLETFIERDKQRDKKLDYVFSDKKFISELIKFYSSSTALNIGPTYKINGNSDPKHISNSAEILIEANYES